jgi:sugar/nucleoside kinase (ribokinase family)
MPNSKFDVLVAGEINPDLVLSGNVLPEFGQVEKIVDNAVMSIGSSSAIFACGVARLGLKVAFIGKCGNDHFGRFMLEEMQKRDVNIDHVIIEKEGKTGLSVILTAGADRAILTYLGLIPSLRAEDIPDNLLLDSRHLHVASYFLQEELRPGLRGLFTRAQQMGLTTSLDTNYDPSEQWLGFNELLAVTNLFFPNETEVKSLTHETDINRAAEAIRSKTGIAAIKLGAKGALGVSSTQTIKVDSIPVKVADTVGAGDSFAAGFIYGYLHQWNLDKSLRLACVCGALSTRAAGGTSSQPALEEAMQYA